MVGNPLPTSWEGGMRELTLQKRLGDASPESLRIYTRVSELAHRHPGQTVLDRVPTTELPILTDQRSRTRTW
jgi:hypothetical protein